MTEGPYSAPPSPPPAATRRSTDPGEQGIAFFAEITHALATAADGPEVLGLILDRLHAVLACETAAVVALGPEPDRLVVRAVRPAGSAPGLTGREFEREGSLVDRALREARAISIRPAAEPPDDLIAALASGIVRGGIVLPVRGPGAAELGALVVLNPAETAAPDLRFLLAVADQAAVVLHASRSVQTRAEESLRVNVLSTVLQAACAGLEEEALIRRAMEALQAAFPADATEVVVCEGAELRLRYASTRAGDRTVAERAGRSRALHLQTVERGEAMLLGRAAGSDGGPEESPVAGIPLRSGDRTLGSLLVRRRAPPFQAREIEALAAVGRYVGIAIELSRLFRRAAVDADRLERVAAERSSALQAAREQLARSQWLASLGEIAAGVAHDLNNALNPIVAFAELIKEHIDQPEKVRTYADRILMAAQGGAETVRRIQRFTRHRIGSAPFQPLSVSGLVSDAVELLRPTLAERPAPIQVSESVGPKLFVYGNAGELRHALLNVLTNAIDAMPRGGTLRFVARAEGDHVALAVQDTGAGMPPEIRARALEPFFTTKGARGTGLGLAEVFGIVQRHGGTLELESWPDLGTTVLMRLPGVAGGLDSESHDRSARDLARRRHRILLIDDNVLGLEATATSLRAAGHSVVTAHNANAALRLFRSGRYDVVFSDLGLPDLDGWELVDRLRHMDPSIRIGVITGWTIPEHDDKLAQYGIEVVLSKPVDPDHLLNLL